VARVLPFRAIRYSQPAGADISALTAPPYDVVTDAARDTLLGRDPHNVVALELAEGATDPAVHGSRYETAGARWKDWLEGGVLSVDDDPAVYVLEQAYTHGGKQIVRRGFVAAVGLEPFSAGIVLPHERTLPKAIDDRLNITRATAANLSQVFGLFADPHHGTAALIAKATAGAPLAMATDDDGVVSTVWALRDPADHEELSRLMADRQIFIADGHHRYTTALAYRDERREASPGSDQPDACYETVMMALVDIDDPGLTVWPTHRIVDADGAFDTAAFLDRLSARFELSDLPPGHPSAALADASSRPSFIVRTRDGVTKLARLREDVDHASAFPGTASQAWRELDVAVLQELVLWPLLGVHPDHPATLERLSFSKDAHQALAAAREHDVVFIMNPTPMRQVAAVALAGEIMPQKSTYFYPKLLSGLLFKSLA
jgi:uncharacterized protein (DUF1015 family)